MEIFPLENNTNTSLVVAAESINPYNDISLGKVVIPSTLCDKEEDDQRKLPPYLITSNANSNKSFSVFFNVNMDFFNTTIKRNLASFFYSIPEDVVVSIYLGGQFNPNFILAMPSYISMLLDTKATVITKCYGPCSFIESAMWLYGKKRVFSNYGALSYGAYDIVKTEPRYSRILDIIYNKAKELNVLTEDEISLIKEKNKEIFLIKNDLASRIF